MKKLLYKLLGICEHEWARLSFESARGTNAKSLMGRNIFGFVGKKCKKCGEEEIKALV